MTRNFHILLYTPSTTIHQNTISNRRHEERLYVYVRDLKKHPQ